jgi:hypothetical protein
MVMRHFGGGIGHLQSQKGDEVKPETDSISSSEDGDLNLSSGAQLALDEGGDTDMETRSSDDDSMESGMTSSAEDDSEPELDTNDDGYDSL